jgi:hypothetical protein
MTVSETTDNITIRVYDSADAPAPDFVPTATPTDSYQTHNVTRDAYHEAVIGVLNGAPADLTVDALALGDATVSTSNLSSSAALGNELFRTSLTDSFTDAQTFSASVFLDSTEANGNDFEEAALISEQSNGQDLPINRFLISDPGGLLSPKSPNETVTIDIEITQQDA